MPEGMTGQQLVAAARQYQPDLKVVYTTGYAASPPSGPGAVPTGERMLRKPYRRQDLARAIRSALDSQGTPVLAAAG